MVVTASINVADIEKMLKEAIERETGRRVASIDFTINETGGYMDRGGSYRVTGCTIRFKADDESHDRWDR